MSNKAKRNPDKGMQVKKEEEEESFADLDDSKANQSVSKSDMNARKGGSKDEWRCLDCQKCYKSYPAFYTHNKLKHGGQPPKNYDIPRSLEDIRKDRGRPRVTDTNQRIKFTVQDKHQQRCEDNLYEFLGKLGQKGDESGQKENSVIRGYLQKTLDPVEKFPVEQFIQSGSSAQFEVVKQEVKVLNDELQKNLEQWEFVDPLDLKPDDMSEFSIYNLKSLFYNLHITKKMSNKYTTLCVFLIWVSKELLEDAYKEICLLAVTYTERYWKLIESIIERHNQEEPLALQVRRERNTFKEDFLSNVKKNFEGVFERMKIFNDANDVKQFIDKYMAWYYHFDDEQLFEGQDKQDLSDPNNEHEENEEDEEVDSQQSLSDDEEEDDEEPKPKKAGKGASKKSQKEAPKEDAALAKDDSRHD